MEELDILKKAGFSELQVKIYRCLLENYAMPVEIQAYEDKIALIAIGEIQMATIITSPLNHES